LASRVIPSGIKDGENILIQSERFFLMNQQDLLTKFPVTSGRLRLRKERHCVLIIDRVYGLYWEIPPNQAVIFSLFNGAFTVTKIGEIISSIYSVPRARAVKAVCDTITLLSNHNLVSLQNNGVPNNFFWDPKNFIFASEEPNTTPLYKGPVMIEFLITNSCNFRCSYCYMNSPDVRELDEQMDFRLFKKIAQQARDLEVKRAVLSGGEPLLCKDFSKMVELLCSYDIFPYISTNGFLVTNDLVDKLYSLGITFIHVSFDSHNPLTFDALTGKKGAFEAVKKNLQFMKNKGMNILTKSVITKENCREVEKLIDFCYQLGVFKLEIAPCIPSVRGRRTLHSLILDDDERIILKEVVTRKKEEYKSCFEISYSDPLKKWAEVKPETYCVGGISSLVIFPNGRADICEMIPDEEKFNLGNLNEKSLSEIWNSEKVKSIRNIPKHLLSEICKKCQYQTTCRTGCFNLSKVVYGDYFSPDPRCPARDALPK